MQPQSFREKADLEMSLGVVGMQSIGNSGLLMHVGQMNAQSKSLHWGEASQTGGKAKPKSLEVVPEEESGLRVESQDAGV
jgi:hypothetical protein